MCIRDRFYVRLFGHVLGHANWDHFINNMLLFLVVAPPLEERYGSRTLLCGITMTAVVSGVLQCVLFPGTALLGASGIVFMLIMLSSLAGKMCIRDSPCTAARWRGRWRRACGVPLQQILDAVVDLGSHSGVVHGVQVDAVRACLLYTSDRKLAGAAHLQPCGDVGHGWQQKRVCLDGIAKRDSVAEDFVDSAHAGLQGVGIKHERRCAV